MEYKMSLRQEKIKISVIVGIIVFSTVFLVTGMMMNTVYGVETPQYAEIIRITENATNLTEGYLIDGYVKTIENATEYSGLGE